MKIYEVFEDDDDDDEKNVKYFFNDRVRKKIDSIKIYKY